MLAVPPESWAAGITVANAAASGGRGGETTSSSSVLAVSAPLCIVWRAGLAASTKICATAARSRGFTALFASVNVTAHQSFKKRPATCRNCKLFLAPSISSCENHLRSTHAHANTTTTHATHTHAQHSDRRTQLAVSLIGRSRTHRTTNTPQVQPSVRARARAAITSARRRPP